MYKPVTSLVNGEIIKDLLDLCNREFIKEPFAYSFAGDNLECRFCGAVKSDNNDTANHSETHCPVVKYQDIAEKHKRWIVKK